MLYYGIFCLYRNSIIISVLLFSSFRYVTRLVCIGLNYYLIAYRSESRKMRNGKKTFHPRPFYFFSPAKRYTSCGLMVTYLYLYGLYIIRTMHAIPNKRNCVKWQMTFELIFRSLATRVSAQKRGVVGRLTLFYNIYMIYIVATQRLRAPYRAKIRSWYGHKYITVLLYMNRVTF